jgi:hypothetical protein
MAKTGRRPLTGMGADAFFGGSESSVKEEEQSDSQTVAPAHSDTVAASYSAPEEDQVIKTSFYPKPAQLDKLDDLASEYNRIHRRKRPRINRNDIVRFLIDLVDLDMLDKLNLKR